MQRPEGLVNVAVLEIDRAIKEDMDRARGGQRDCRGWSRKTLRARPKLRFCSKGNREPGGVLIGEA